MRAIIIGGGIAGLTAALALEKAGIWSDVYEAAPALRPAGAGISLAVNAMRIYRALGLADLIATEGAEAQWMQITDEHLRPISSSAIGDLRDRYGAGVVLIHRARLQAILLGAIGQGKVHTGKRLKALAQDDKAVMATFEDGSTATADLLIGADGIHSATRSQLFPEVPLRYSGQTCWRGITRFELPDDAKLRQFEAWGGRLRFGCTPVGHGEVYWYAVETAAEGGKDDSPALNEELSRKFAAFAAPVPALIQATSPDHIIRNDLHDLTPMPLWHRGRALLIGDAAHATTPNMGQGGCQAAEDAFTLGRILQSETDLERAFARFEEVRRPKVNRVVSQSLRIGRVAHWEHARGLRDWLMRRIPRSMLMRQVEWLYEVAV